jgi:hypothetical protein
VRIDLSDAKGPLIAHWINIDSGEFGPPQRFSGGGKLALAPPGKENWSTAIIAP